MIKIKKLNFQRLSFGVQGELVLISQKKLNFIGYRIEENGNFDFATAHAVRDFQIKSNFLVVDGVIGIYTMIAIDSTISLQKVQY